MELLRFATAGSVDDGKSTLIGRLLLETKQIFEDQLEAVERTSRDRGFDYTNLALLTDEGQLDSLQTADGELVYRRCHSERHHHHVVCRECGRGTEVELPDLERWAETTATDLGYSDVTHTVEIFGVCADCRR